MIIVCDQCGVELKADDDSVEAANKEYKRNFPEVAPAPIEPIIVVCDDCYRGLMSALGRSII